VKLEAIELIRVQMPLVEPFRTSFGVQHDRDVLLVHVLAEHSEGWGECVAAAQPRYSSEFVDAAEVVIRRFAAPTLLARPELCAAKVAPMLRWIRDHRMAKSALEMAVLDAELRAAGVRLADYLGGVKDEVPVGVSVGIADSIGALLERIEEYLHQGYARIKLKIEPGWDIEPVQAVRERFGDELLLQVDANMAYRRSDLHHLLCLDAYGLLLVEQPFPAGDLAAHAELARRSCTPVCLDESIESATDAFAAIVADACQVVNVKAGRVGGYLEARRVHDVCAAAGVPVWCGGMLETGIGRAANIALASLPNFTLPGDISATDRYYARDLTDPFRLTGSNLKVPGEPGLGVQVSASVLADLGATHSLLREAGG
jgi:O-succinylbenzoate synthase